MNEAMPSDEGELSKSDEGELSKSDEVLIKNIAIILGHIIKIYHSFPKKLFAILSVLFFIINAISAIFEYDKIDFDKLTLNTILNTLTLEILILVIIISFAISLIKGFYNYIDKNEKRIFEMKHDYSKTHTDCTDKIELIKEQNIARPIFIDKYLIKNMISEIENYINLKANNEIIEKYIPVLEIKLVSNKIIEITASKNDNSIIAERMIFEIWRQKQIAGHSFHDPYGLVSVFAHPKGSFKSILINSQPEDDYWNEMIVDLKDNNCKRVDDFYLKIYIPEDISRTDEDTLNNLLIGLNQL